MFTIMTIKSPRIPLLITSLFACAFIFSAAMIRAYAQSSQPDSTMVTSQSVIGWIVAVAGFVSLVSGIVYGFVKKQKYENLETERNELKSLAESREQRIKELKYVASEADAKAQLRDHQKDQVITNLSESNSALVSQGLQMKAILRNLRLEGVWHGHEDNIHDTQ